MTFTKQLRALLAFIFWSLLFSVTYTQSPLYTSNQNTYFLHGFACADIGYLRQDWLANTRDATPLFSILVCATLRWLRLQALFYLYYALILGAYFLLSLRIAQKELNLKPRARKLVFISLFFLIHSASWRFVISRILGAEWTYAFEGGLANQRLLGSVFEPSVFGIFLLTAIWLASQEKFAPAVISLALATWFHPTYLLPATLIFCGLIAFFFVESSPAQGQCFTRQQAVQALRWSFLYLLLIAPSAIYALSFTFGIESGILEQGKLILFKIRIPHHADPKVWFNLSSLFQIALMIGALILTRQKTLRWLCGLPLLISMLLTLLVVFTHNINLALLFPWRVTTVLLPISVTVILSRVAGLIPAEPEQQDRDLLRWILPSVATSLIAVMLLVGWVRISLDLQRYKTQIELPLLEFVSQHKQRQDVYLIPLKMQNFRLTTGAAVFVDFKSTPYYPTELIEWQRRYQLAMQFFRSPSCSDIDELRSEGITHIVLPESASLTCSMIAEVYSDNHYQLLRITHAEDAPALP
ncbi:MAG: hypothetical protein Kow0088_09280 [Anaerolineales bacterium]